MNSRDSRPRIKLNTFFYRFYHFQRKINAALGGRGPNACGPRGPKRSLWFILF